MLWSKNKKNRYTPANSGLSNLKVGFNVVYISWTCFPDEYEEKKIYKTTAVCNIKTHFLEPQLEKTGLLGF